LRSISLHITISMSRSMISARVAGVPMPFSFSISANSSDSTSFPAVSMAAMSIPSVNLGAGLVCLFSADVSKTITSAIFGSSS